MVAMFTYFARNLFRTRVGRAFIAIRDRDISAELMGINLFRYKILSFMVSSFYAGVAGAVWVYFTKVVTPEYFPLSLSIQFLAIIDRGGLGSIQGTIFGAIFMTLVPELLEGGDRRRAKRFFPDAMSYLFPMRDILFGAMIVGFLVFEPHGLAEMWQQDEEVFRTVAVQKLTGPRDKGGATMGRRGGKGIFAWGSWRFARWLAAGAALAADDEIKIGACQPITGTVRLRGGQHQRRAPGLHQLRQRE